MEDAKKTYSTRFTIPFGDCRVAGATVMYDYTKWGHYELTKSQIEDILSALSVEKEIQKYKTLRSVTKINHIMKNGDYTTVLWADGTKTIVKKATDEKDDPEMALAYALLKKIKGNNASEVRRYFEEAEKKTIVKEKKKK